MHVHLPCASSFRFLLRCKDGVCVPGSHLPCGMEVISERRRKKCQLYVAPVQADIITQFCCWAVDTVGVAMLGDRGWLLGSPQGVGGLDLQVYRDKHQVRRRAASLPSGSSASDIHPQGRSWGHGSSSASWRLRICSVHGGVSWPWTCSVHTGTRVAILHLQMGPPRLEGKSVPAGEPLDLQPWTLSLESSASQTITGACSLKLRLLRRDHLQHPEGCLHTQPWAIPCSSLCVHISPHCCISNPHLAQCPYTPLGQPSLTLPCSLLCWSNEVPGLKLPLYLLLVHIPLFWKTGLFCLFVCFAIILPYAGIFFPFIFYFLFPPLRSLLKSHLLEAAPDHPY